MTKRGDTTDRGYGHTHRQARKHALANLKDGDPCCRCRQPMYRTHARHLDLDHSTDRTTYLGLAHATCNRSAGARWGNTLRGHQPQPAPIIRRSTHW